MKAERELRLMDGIKDRNRVKYEVIEEHLLIDGREGVTYGIRAYREGDVRLPLAEIRDITLDSQELLCFVELCNSLGLSLLHLTDVIEDFLAK